jgi:hypothetical protein
MVTYKLYTIRTHGLCTYTSHVSRWWNILFLPVNTRLLDVILCYLG